MNRNSKAYRTAVMIEHRVFGVAFLVLLLFFGWFTQAVFNKQFTDFVEVDLLAAKSGLQLPAGADVKIRGVIVGEVRDRDVTPEGATLTLGLFPDQLDTIPSNVSARLLPKTLFGEKYVALQVPEQPSSSAIGSDDVIEQTEVAIEVEKVLNDIYPLLRAVQPAEINYTLTAIATALEGRGEDIGNNLSVLNDYLERTNPQIPALVEDLRLLSEVSDVYRSVMPDLARMLRNSATTGKTFVEKEQKIQALFTDMAGFASTSKDFLERNGENIIRLAELGKQQLRVFAKYSPEYPCLLSGIVRLAPLQSETLRGKILHIHLEPLPKQPRPFTAKDDHRYGDTRGPNCLALPSPSWSQTNLPPPSIVPDIDDGVDEPTGKMRSAPIVDRPVDMTSGYAGTQAERQLVNAIAAPVLGVPASEVPDLTSLLFGPIARGTEVALR